MSQQEETPRSKYAGFDQEQDVEGDDYYDDDADFGGDDYPDEQDQGEEQEQEQDGDEGDENDGEAPEAGEGDDGEEVPDTPAPGVYILIIETQLTTAQMQLHQLVMPALQ